MTGLPPPILLNDLRFALACLYNLPGNHHHHHQHQQPHLNLKQAQDYLVFIQSRNNRRKIASLIQRQRDKPQAAQIIPPNTNSASGGDVVTAGSSWLACLALLCQQQQQQQTTAAGADLAASSPERLFAAQSLLHRLLRSPIHQAIDLEMELSSIVVDDGGGGGDIVPLLFHQLQHPLPLPQMMDQYQHYIHQFNSFVGTVVSHYQGGTHYHNHNANNNYHDEDRVKGELAVITLTAIMYVTAMDPNRDQNTNPILNSLGSAVAATALRLRFTPKNNLHQNNNNTQQQQQQQHPETAPPPPLLTIITQALHLVFHTAAAGSSSSSSSSSLNLQASSDCLRACLAAIPDICFGSSGGGARGRMSMDPKCIQEAVVELRTIGMEQLWNALQQHSQDMLQQQQQQQQYSTAQSIVHENILIICERWARFLPMPLEFIQHTVPLARQYIISHNHGSHQHHHQHHNNIRKPALSYLVALFEGGTWTPDQIVAKSLGLSPDQQQINQQANKKRQSSKSKKRQKDFLDTHSNDAVLDQAQSEFHHRGAIACHTAVMVWETLRTAFRETLAEGDATRHDTDEIEIEGEGPIGCLAACANACLPHILRNSSSPTRAFPHSKELFLAISETFQEMCQSRYRVIRAFSMEPLYSLHNALIQHVLQNESTGGHVFEAELQNAVVDHFFKCSMSLATSCGYPADYFHHMGASSDEDLEIERNDVRDVLRTVAVSEGGGSTAFADCSRPPLDVTLQILSRLLHACSESIQSARNENRLFPEAAAHCFSALAKPLNQLSKCYLKSGKPDNANEILRLALQTLCACLQGVVDAFPTTSLPELFPASRVVDLAIASLSPMISNSCNNPALLKEIDEVLRLSLKAASLSIAHIPELASPSELGHQIYDIRGAMRGPGGEDHVGCLAIMRLAFDSEDLANKLVEVGGSDVQHLCTLHAQLKTIETSREKDIIHGKGVAPKSRRILLGIICHLEVVTAGKAGCAAMLTDLFNTAVTAIAHVDSSAFHDESTVFQMCENTWDLTAFSPVIVASLFNNEGDLSSAKMECIRNLTTCICNGFQRLSIHQEATPVDFQWNRLRAAFFTLLQTAASGDDLPAILVEAIEAMNRAECQAIHAQCQAGPASASSLFNDEIISEENVPAGLFAKVVGEFIGQVHAKGSGIERLQNVVDALHRSKPFILSTIMLSCPDPTGFVDPRPTLSEAWFLTIDDLVSVVQNSQAGEAPLVKDIIVETCAVAVTFPFYPSMGKSREERSSSPFMSLEGPQTLALYDLVSDCFQLGPNMLREVVQHLQGRIPLDSEKAGAYSRDPWCLSTAIIGAALFRSAQGALPPWAVETAPAVYSSLFIAFDRDVNAFCKMLQIALELRLANGAHSFGSVLPGQLLAGPLFEDTKSTSKQLFLQQATENVKQDNSAGWKRMKVLVKQISGGKKSNTDFKQKPSPTKFEFDRI